MWPSVFRLVCGGLVCDGQVRGGLVCSVLVCSYIVCGGLKVLVHHIPYSTIECFIIRCSMTIKDMTACDTPHSVTHVDTMSHLTPRCDM